MAKMVLDTVRITDNAKSPRDQKVKRFDVDPPGVEPTMTILNPTALLTGSIIARINEMSGINPNCDINAIARVGKFFFTATRLKDLTVNVPPRPSINITTITIINICRAMAGGLWPAPVPRRL